MVEKTPCYIWNAILPLHYDSSPGIINGERGTRPSCRAFRLVKDSLWFLFLTIPWRYPKDSLRISLRNIVDDGVQMRFCIGSEANREYGHLAFQFLGFTESGVKSGHIILLQQTIASSGEEIPTPATLLQKFGNLRDVFEVDGPGKYVARLSLSFSSTVESVNPSQSEVIRIADERAENGVLTTDGCGVIRMSYAKEICSRHNFDSATSVFQIRRGGIKGLVVAYPDELFDVICQRSGYAAANNHKIAYRRSMFKYEGGPTHIEINGISKPAEKTRLSVSTIILLMSLYVQYRGILILTKGSLVGVKELLKLQLRSIKMIAYDRQEALNYIEGELDAQGNSFYQELYEMLYAGHSLNDAYVRKRLRQCQRLQYKTLREKLNIKVQKSCSVYGVVDELGVLGENEVYLRLPHREGILVSDVVITRHPHYKLSDIRLLKAVDKPELSFLTNCIVFPRSGPYSVPGSMSGGDLDGDKYFVCWDQSIFPLDTVAPASPSSPPSAAGIDWSRRNLNYALVDLFAEQHHSSLLGSAANEWVAVADKYLNLAGSGYPEVLADVIEEALDILKSGASYQVLWARYRTILSDFKEQSQAVKCRKSRLRPLRDMIPSVKEDQEIHYEPDPDLNLRSQRPQEWVDEYKRGSRLIKLFNKGLSDAISKDEIYQMDGVDEIARRRRDDNGSFADVYKARFIEKYFPRSPGILSETNVTSYVRASAWYYVGYDEQKPAFAWLGARFLNNIKSYETNGGRPGMSVGALKTTQSVAPPLDDPNRPLWHYDRIATTQYCREGRQVSEETASHSAYINRVRFDADLGDERSIPHAYVLTLM